MNDFWSNRLAGVSPSPAPPTPVSGNAWWAAPSPVPVQQPVQPVAQPAPAPTTTKARSARLQETCPECGSNNYFRPEGSGNVMVQCYECGYNPRFAHSTAGISIPSDAGAPQAARQLNPTGISNFNPGSAGHVIAHL